MDSLSTIQKTLKNAEEFGALTPFTQNYTKKLVHYATGRKLNLLELNQYTFVN